MINLIAPGIWKLTLGQPESLTPSSLLTPRPDRDERLAALPSVADCPLPFNTNAPAITTAPTPRGFQLRLPLDAREQLYGLGLQLLSFNQTGLKKTLRVNSDPIADLGDSHAPVPFYVSNAGYAVLVDTTRYATFYCGSANPVAAAGGQDAFGVQSFTAPQAAPSLETDVLYAARQATARREVVVEIPGAQGVSVFIFAGPSLREAVQRYNLFSGGGVVPPRWALGVWYRGRSDFTQDQTDAFTARLRDEAMPCDVFGLEPGWQTHSYSCSHVWSDKFPDPAALVALLTARHFRINLWTHVFTHPTSPIFKDLQPHSGPYTTFGGLVPDFLQPEAARIFGNHYQKTTVDLAISGFKLDECDGSDFIKSPWSFPEFGVFPSGADGEQMHSLFGTLQQRLMQHVYERSGKRTFGLVRNAHAFAAPLPFVLYSDLYDHAQFVRGVCTAGFSGLLWTPEIRHAHSGLELVRRLQSAVASPMLLVNAWYIKNPPWKQWAKDANNADQLLADWPEWQAKCRAVFELRMQLVPYLHAAFHRYATEGLPPFRALVMDYPDCPESHRLDDQILLGDRLMAAPIIGTALTRSLWLPPGVWVDFWTGERLVGNRIHTLPPVHEHLPLFVKDDSLLPLARVSLHTDAPDSFELEVRVYGTGEHIVTLLEDSAPDAPFTDATANRLTLSWDATSRSLRSHRARSDLPALYRVHGHTKI